MRIDLHVHTKYSKCSLMEPEKLIKVAIKRGLSGIAITDHNTMKALAKLNCHNQDDFIIIPGEEIKTDKGEVIGLFLQSEIKPKEFDDVIDEIKGQDGLIVLPHPFDRFRGFKSKIPKDIDALEAINSRTIFFSDNFKALKFAKKLDIPITAGSDAHFYWEVGNAYVIADVSDEEDLRKAILKGKTRVVGKRGNPLNHVVTKVVKIWRTIKF